MTKPKFKVGQHWRTRDGEAVRILATDADGERPIVGQDAETEEVFTWHPDGRVGDYEDDGDLVELLPEQHDYERWANIYQDGGEVLRVWPTRAAADRHAQPGRIACLHIKIPYRAGDGLNDGEAD